MSYGYPKEKYLNPKPAICAKPAVAFWNGEKCNAQKGTAIVGKSPVATWWCAKLEGYRRKCVRVDYHGEIFYLDDEDGSGSNKVFRTAGGPFCAGHKSLPVDDDSTFIKTA